MGEFLWPIFDLGENVSVKRAAERQGFMPRIIEYDMENSHFDDGEFITSFWHPPAQPGEYMAGKWSTEDGAFALFVTPLTDFAKHTAEGLDRKFKQTEREGTVNYRNEIKAIEAIFDYGKSKLDALKKKMEEDEKPNPWDGEVWNKAREWQIQNNPFKAIAVSQGEDMSVKIHYAYIDGHPDEWKVEYGYLDSSGDYPEHPRGWHKSFTQLPPLPPLDEWPEGVDRYQVEGSLGEYYPQIPGDRHPYVYHFFGEAVGLAWVFTRKELEQTNE